MERPKNCDYGGPSIALSLYGNCRYINRTNKERRDDSERQASRVSRKGRAKETEEKGREKEGGKEEGIYQPD